MGESPPVGIDEAHGPFADYELRFPEAVICGDEFEPAASLFSGNVTAKRSHVEPKWLFL